MRQLMNLAFISALIIGVPAIIQMEGWLGTLWLLFSIIVFFMLIGMAFAVLKLAWLGIWAGIGAALGLIIKYSCLGIWKVLKYIFAPLLVEDSKQDQVQEQVLDEQAASAEASAEAVPAIPEAQEGGEALRLDKIN